MQELLAPRHRRAIMQIAISVMGVFPGACPTVVNGVALCGLSLAHARQAGEPATLSGIFTTEQAKDGERTFRSRCAPCHGADLHAIDPTLQT